LTLAVTTFSPEGYEKYGKNCLATLSRHWPGRIVAFYEEAAPLHDFPYRVELRGFYAIPGVNEYLTKLKRHPGSDGTGPQGYDFRYDAAKFCRKVFAQDAVFDEDQYVYWIDADCVIQKDIPEQLLKSLLVKPFCYLGRKGQDAYTETGILGFNTKHSMFPQFRKKYLSYFTTGKIFSQLKGWHDCIAFDYARQGIDGNNLTPHVSGNVQVIQDSPLGKYMVHLKGPRKFSDKHTREAVGG